MYVSGNTEDHNSVNIVVVELLGVNARVYVSETMLTVHSEEHSWLSCSPLQHTCQVSGFKGLRM